MAKRSKVEKIEEEKVEKSDKDELFFFERGLAKLIKKIIRQESEILTRDEIKQIIDELLPDLDKLVSKIVKSHLSEMAQHILKTMKEESNA